MSFTFFRPQNIIKTIAGTGTTGTSGDGGAATVAQLSSVSGLTTDTSGNIYVSDSSSCTIRFIIKQTNIITTIAGMASFCGGEGDDDVATSATLDNPEGVSLDTINNLLYVADMNNCKIRMVTLSLGIITTFAGTGISGSDGDSDLAVNALLSYPEGVANDLYGNVYIADSSNCKIRKVNSGGIITTYAGTGIVGSSGDGLQATSATLHYPQGVAVDRFGNVYIADTYNHLIRVVNNVGIITTIAGDGVSGLAVDGTLAVNAHLGNPTGVVVDVSGNVYIADAMTNNVVYKVANGTGLITTFAGNGKYGSAGDGGPATSAYLNYATTVAVDSSGIAYIGDVSRVREVISITNSHAPTPHPTAWPLYKVRLLYCFLLRVLHSLIIYGMI